jgi:tubulin polyglutamylase TTLL2
MGEYSAGKSYQKLIHFPKTGALCTKDNLARIIKRNRGWFGKIYHFTPNTYCLPNETKQFMDAFSKQAVSGQNTGKQIWICKPNDLSRGRKITLISNVNDLEYD